MSTTVATLQAVFTADTSGFDTAANGVQTKLGNLGTSVENFGTKMTGIGARLMVVTAPLALAFGYSATKAIEFETAMAGVEKTVGGTDTEMKELADQIKIMATSSDNPLSSLDNAHVTLANIMEIAGQLGVTRSSLVPFTETMGLLAMTTNLSAEEAATMSARFANITGMDFTNIDRFGSAIVDIGNNSATTESEVLTMALRLAAAGTAAGLSEPEILGIAGALSSVGVSAELGGGNMSRFINGLTLAVSAGGPALDRIAEKAGLTATEFKALYDSDPATAITTLISAMGEMDQSGRMETLEELGITGSEAADVIGRLALNSALLSGTMAIANNAWEENTALTDEAATKAATTESNMNRLRNQVTGLAITVGIALLPALNNIIEKLTPLITEFANFAEAHPGVIAAVAAFSIALFGLGMAMTILGPIVTALGGLIAFGGTALSLGMGAAGLATGALTTALGLLFSPIAIVIGLGAALGIAMYMLKDKLLGVADAIGGAVVAAFDAVMGKINDVIGGIEDAAQKIGSA